MNYFSLFDIQPNFDLDIKVIKAKYLLLQSKFHPDKATNDLERLKFLELSININNAYKILIDNFLRAQYILKLNNIDLASENSPESTKLVDQHILLQAMDDQEMLEDLQTNAELQQLYKLKNSATVLLIDVLKQLFAEKKFLLATTKTIELKYHLKFLTDIKAKISKLYATSPNH